MTNHLLETEADEEPSFTTEHFEIEKRIGAMCEPHPRVSYEITPPDGKCTTCSFDTRREAEAWLADNKRRFPDGYRKDYVVSEWKHYRPYTRSLDAMHEAEKTLNEQERAVFAICLATRMEDWGEIDPRDEDAVHQYIEFPAPSTFGLIHANPLRRAQALLKARGAA